MALSFRVHQGLRFRHEMHLRCHFRETPPITRRDIGPLIIDIDGQMLAHNHTHQARIIPSYLYAGARESKNKIITIAGANNGPYTPARRVSPSSFDRQHDRPVRSFVSVNQNRHCADIITRWREPSRLAHGETNSASAPC